MRNKVKEMGKATLTSKHDLWLTNIYENALTSYSFEQDIKELEDKHRDEKCIIVSAGCHQDWLNRGDLDKIYAAKNRPLIVACDHAVPLFVDKGYTPDYIVSVDGSPLIAKYFWRKLKDKPEGVLLLTQTHPLTVEMIEAHGYPIYWFQHYENKNAKDLHIKGVSECLPLGNVGTTALVLAYAQFRCKPIGLLDIEFAWSDETPYRANDRQMRTGYKKIHNKLMNEEYIMDYVYNMYLESFKNVWKLLKKKRIFTLTKEGVIPTVVQYKSLGGFLKE